MSSVSGGTKFCPGCGTQLTAGFRSCPSCGRSFAATAGQAAGDYRPSGAQPPQPQAPQYPPQPPRHPSQPPYQAQGYAETAGGAAWAGHPGGAREASVRPPPPSYRPGGSTVPVTYAGFWVRFGALIIDGLIIGLVLGAIGLVAGFVLGMGGALSQGAVDENQLSSAVHGLIGFLYLGGFIGQWLYFAGMESSRSQATFGKKLCGLKVVDGDGRRIGFGRASGRFFGKILSGLIFSIGYMMAGWTAKKQALHDLMAGTCVVKA